MQTEQTFQSTFTWSLPKRPSIYGQFSPLLMDSKITLHLNQGLDSEQSIRFIGQYKSLIEGILQLGELEHTGDWDPYFSIILHDGTKLDTSAGYPDILAYKDDSEVLKYYRNILLPSLDAYQFGLITAERLEESEDLDDVDASEEEIAEAKQKFTNLGIKALDDDYGSPGVIMVAIPISTIKSITLEY